MLPQLEVLSIEEIYTTRATQKFRGVQAIQRFENLISLQLGSQLKLPNKQSIWKMEPFLQTEFPKLNEFKISWDFGLPNELLSQFLQSHQKTLKTLCIDNTASDVDFSGILELQQLKVLHLNSYERTLKPIDSIISNLFQLKNLTVLRLGFCCKRDIFKALLKSFQSQQFQQLTEVFLALMPFDYSTDITDVRDEDLMYLKYLPRLTYFLIYIESRLTYVTLPGIMQSLKHCPQMLEFVICGVRQNYSPDGNFPIDDDIYEKFRQAYYYDANQMNSLTIDYEHYNCKHYVGAMRVNMVDFFKKWFL